MGSKLDKEYGMVSQVQIYHFGHVQVYQDSYNHQFFIQTYDFMVDPHLENQFIDHLAKKNNSCPNLMQIKHIDISRKNYCSNSAQISVTFQYTPHTLQNLIDRNHIFSQAESKWSITELQKYYTGFSQQSNILMIMIAIMEIFVHSSFTSTQRCRSDYVFKIFDSAYFHPVLNGYYRAKKQKAYSAPEVLANLGEKRVYPLYNHHIADTFSIGLVVLYCMSLINPLGAYTKKFQIDFYYIQSMFRLAQRKGFSSALIGLIRQCLQQRNRPNVSEVFATFQKLNLKQQMQYNGNKFSLKKSRSTNILSGSQQAK